MCLAHDVVAGYILAVPRGTRPIDRMPVHFGEEDVRDGAKNILGSTLKQVRKSDQEPSVTESNGVVHVGEGKKIDFQLWQGRMRPQFAVAFLENFEDPGSHGERSIPRCLKGLFGASAAGRVRIQFLVLRSVFLLFQQLAMLFGRGVKSFQGIGQHKLVSGCFASRYIRCILQGA